MPPSDPSDPEATVPKPARVLVVEDSPANLDIVLHLLGQEETLSLEAARSGHEALEALSRALPDLVLLDVMLPDLDGYTLCRRLKADPATRDIPVLFLTARNEPEDVARGFEAGGVDYVTKPFEPLELRARVFCHLAQKRWADQERALVAKLESALAQVKTLSGLIPICAQCKKVRDDQGFWQQVEGYIATHSQATFSHGLCPECIRELYPDFRKESHGA